MGYDAADSVTATDTGDKSFKARPWDLIDQYDLRKPIARGLDTLTQEEIIAARMPYWQLLTL